jgi:hypothetical protein
MRLVFRPGVPPTEAFLDGIWELLCHNHGNRILHKLVHYIPDPGRPRPATRIPALLTQRMRAVNCPATVRYTPPNGG